MAALKFNHAFAIAMCACAASALFLPEKVSAPVKNAVAMIFAPVAAPVHSGSSWLENRVAPGARGDANAPPGNAELAAENTKLAAENEQLHVTVISLSRQLEDLKKLNLDRESLGELRPLSVVARVIGLDAGGRQMLQVSGPKGATFNDGMAAISLNGYVGQVIGGFRGAARVRLVTDPESKIVCAFGRMQVDDAGRLVQKLIPGLAPLVEGMGSGGMHIIGLSQRIVEQGGVQVGDWLVINDEQRFPPNLQGLKVGRVTAISKSRVNALMAEITVQPRDDLTQLKEVYIVTK